MNPQRQITSNGDADALARMADIYQSRYICLSDMKEIGKAVMFKIKAVQTEVLESIIMNGRKIEGGEKGIIVLDRKSGKTELILNKTSFKELKRAWGTDKSNWIGAMVKIEAGKLNGKELLLVTPVMASEDRKQAKQTQPPPPEDDLAFDGPIPE